MYRVVALAGCILLAIVGPRAVLAAGPDDAVRTISGPVAAEVIKVRDGDTIEVEAHIWPQQTVRVAVRLRGIDAPELKAKCQDERSAALAARARLAAMLGDGRVELSQISGDKYFGRVLAAVSTPGEPDFARRLLAEGHVAPYEGGRRGDWCGGGAAKLTSLSP